MGPRDASFVDTLIERNGLKIRRDLKKLETALHYIHWFALDIVKEQEQTLIPREDLEKTLQVDVIQTDAPDFRIF